MVPDWIDRALVLMLHDDLLVQHGGPGGLRDSALLDSALARPQQHYHYNPKASTAELAGIYTAGIVMNHPFVDGNKRTGFVTGVLFLETNGHRFDASEAAAAEAVMMLAAGKMDAEGYISFLQAHSHARD